MKWNACQPSTLALLAAGAWMLHPLNVSSVLYVVQRMNELATMFVLAGLLCYVDGRARSLHGERAMASALLGLCLFGVLAVFNKENGALIFVYALVIEAICFRFDAPQPGQRRLVQGFFTATVALPMALFVAYLTIHPHWLPNSFTGRDFTLAQRLLSESRILCEYLLWIFVPNPAWMGIFHDDIAVSTGLLSPPSTLFAGLFLSTLVVAAWRLRSSSPGFSFAIAWFFAGHSMESTILPLELVFEHRNYLPMAGLLLGTICALAPLVPTYWPSRAVRIGCTILICALAGATVVRAASWGNPLKLAMDDARHHPDSARTQYQAGRELIIDGAQRGERGAAEQAAIPYFSRASNLDTTNVYAAANLLLIEATNGPVAPTALADLANRLRNTSSYVQANPFLDLLSNASRRTLSLTTDDFSILVDAALANRHFPLTMRAMILNNFGEYRFNVDHDGKAAIELTTAAAATEPKNPYFQINLAKIALAMGQNDIAQKHLEAARELDKVDVYDQEIHALQRQTMQ
jgi:hypothetical protein